MILTLVLPQIGEPEQVATVAEVSVSEGEDIAPGSPLLLLRVDMGANRPQDCPPVSDYRLLSSERARVRRVLVRPGETHPAGALLVLFSTGPDEDAEAPPARSLRYTRVAVLSESGWW